MKPIKNAVDMVAETIAIDGMGVPTGYPILDDTMRGLTQGELTVIAGRPSMGKTAYMVDMALNISETKNVGIFSLEMSETQLIERMIANRMETSLYKLKKGIVPVSIKVEEQLSKLSLWVNEDSGIDATYMWETLEKQKKEFHTEFDVLFIDYLQLIRTKNNRNSRYEEIDKICQNLRHIAKEKNIAVVLMAQLNRAVEQRENHQPRLSDLRDSGGIEQVADKILFLYRPAYYKLFEKSDTTTTDDGEAHIIIAKNRNGALGDIPLVWLADSMQFKSLNFELGGTF